MTIADLTDSSLWRIRVDTGGTFTDAWSLGPDGRERRCKILSDGSLRCRVLAVSGCEVTTDSTLRIDDGVLTGWHTPEGWQVTASRQGASQLTLAA
ncbi:MAG: hypothetical protein JWO82_3563, partial [Akkermansiaceae bacterium]|nr:hypothetical protein [Akkermansiaceae bacterium]